jgi:squid-like protein
MDGYYEGGDGQSAGQTSGKGKGVNSADDAAKMFIGGLSWETTEDDLRSYFEQFGAVEDCAIKTDMNTGRPRGFGFVLFADPASVDQVLSVGTHTLSGKTIDPKRAKARGPEPVKKVFVGGLDPNIPEADIRNYFGQFGTIEELILPMDKVNNVRKAFAFITFSSPETVDQLCADSKHMIGDKSVEVKKAVNKPELAQGGYGGRGGGRGGYGGAPRGAGGPRGGGRGGGRGGRYAGAGGGYGQGSWDTTGGYGGGQGYGGGGYDYGGYSSGPAAGGYGQPDPYGQSYGGQGGYDYSGWYGGGAQQGQVNGSGYAPRGAAAGSTGNARYQPYSR